MTAPLNLTLLVYVGCRRQRTGNDFTITDIGEIYFQRRAPAKGEKIQLVYCHGEWSSTLPLLYGDGDTVVFNQHDEAVKAIRQIEAAVHAGEETTNSSSDPS
jgi:hypothetical protein